jgi:hypothetical protein
MSNPKQSGAGVDGVTFSAAYAPDPRNGEVYAAEWFDCRYEDGQEIESCEGFIVVHMSHARGSAATYHSAATYRGFETLAEAQAAAERIAREYNAVLS